MQNLLILPKLLKNIIQIGKLLEDGEITSKKYYLAILRQLVVELSRPKYPVLEAQLMECINERRASGHCVSGVMLKSQALCLATNLEFTASNGWLRNFLLRNRLVRRRATTSGRELPRDSGQKVVSFLETMKKYQANGFERNSLIGMDETSIYLDDPGINSINFFIS